ncbi:HesA/MoeB/ThiF family protein [Luteococcus sp.]|uniref:HesA/MoeB/ThiF family protein n=1 Tax=Luteococcus sp. TaxID=1969402 RepID=UPI003736483D
MAEESRHARHLVLDGFGAEGQELIAAGRVMVLGAGGLGSPVITYLAATGVGRLTIIDDDLVSLSNLQRQVIHTTADLGRPKAESAAERALAINSEVEAVQVVTRLDQASALELVRGHDVVVDATDNFVTRTVLARACQEARVPEVYGAVMAWQGQVTVLEPGRQLEEIFGELPEQAPTGAEVGILATLPGVIGTVMAAETIKLLLGEPQTLCGRLQTYDARTAQWQTFRLPALAPEDRAHEDPSDEGDQP